MLIYSIDANAFFKEHDSLLTSFNNHGSDTTGVHILNNIAFKAYSVNPEELKRYAQKAHNLADSLDFTEGIILSKLNLGLYYFIINDYKEAHRHYRSALELVNKIENSLLKSKVHVRIGVVYQNNNEENKALKEYQKALMSAKEINNKKQIAVVFGNLGNLYEQQGEYQKAITAYNNAVNINQGDNQIGFNSVLYSNIGLVYHSLKEYDLAIDNFLRSIELDSIRNHQYGLSNNFGNIGRTYRITSQYIKAFESYNRAISIDTVINNKSGLIFDYLGLCNLYYDLSHDSIRHNFDSTSQELFSESKIELLQISLRYGKKAEQIINETETKNSALFFVLKNIYKSLGNDSLALFFTDKFWELENELNSLEKSKEFARLESESLALINENKIQKLESSQEQERIILLAALVVLALTIVLTIGTFFRLKNRRKINDELRFLNNSLKEANDSREKFISIIAHDLINPISGVSSALKIYKREKDSFDELETEDYLAALIASSENAKNLLMNLLEWGQLQTGQTKFNPVSTDVNGLILSNIELFKPNARQKKLSLNYSQDNPLIIDCDHYMINSVLSNLIANAIKFSHENSAITISSELMNNHITVSVSDQGIGMTEESLSKIFKISEHNIMPGTKNEKGTGLGLILCKEFVDAHNGEINVQSTLNIGTTFTIKLPIKQ